MTETSAMNDRAGLLDVELCGVDRFQAMYEQAPLGILVVGPGGFIEQANDRFCELVGRPRREILARSWERFTHADDREEQREQATRLARGEIDGFSLEKRYLRLDGGLVWARLNVTRLGGHSSLIMVEDVTARKEAEAALRASEERLRQQTEAQRRYEQALEEAARQKDHFLAILGHELRNPLAAIATAAELLKRLEEAKNPAVERVRAIVERQSAHMSKLVDGLLDVSRIARGKVRLDRQHVDVTALVRHALEDRQELIANHKLELVQELPREPLFATLDKTRVAQVLDNLITNAVKFTDAPGAITVRLYRDDDDVVLSVRDTGVGIEPRLLSQLFEPFLQIDDRVERSAGGLGLGLALVKGLVELHGGHVCARSQGTGTGAELEVRLPRGALHPQDMHEQVVEEPARKRVLVIEDERDVAEMLRGILELSGHRVIVVYDVASALAAAPDFLPDVVFCDIGLPGGLSGYDFARTAAANMSLRRARLVAVTGYGREEDRQRALSAGFDDHLAKPVDMGRLEACLDATSWTEPDAPSR